MYRNGIKRLLAILLSLCGMLVLSPLLLILCIAIKVDSPGPILFKQKRVGIHKKHFNILKFRTMRIDTPHDMPTHLLKDPDQYITRVGHFLRKTSLDELPQFFNVLKGDMSLVGPRPERKYFIDEIVKTAPYYYLLHNVRPGITSLGMVKYGYAASVDKMVERMEYDILYYENMSLTLDLTILIYTVKTVITGKGV